MRQQHELEASRIRAAEETREEHGGAENRRGTGDEENGYAHCSWSIVSRSSDVHTGGRGS